MKRIVFFLLITIVTAGTVLGISSILNDNPNVKSTSHIHPISLQVTKASPDIVRLPIGDYAQFNSRDNKSHDIAQGQGNGYGATHEHDESGIESGKFGPDEAYKIQFKKVGIYDFHDHLHPEIHVTIIAFDPNSSK